MERASDELIRALLEGNRNPPSVRLRGGTRNVTWQPANKVRKARWERIFAEKFLDPNYYNGPITHVVSPLTSCILKEPARYLVKRETVTSDVFTGSTPAALRT